MRPFIAGMMTMGYIVAAIFFVRFWLDTRDRLFVFFGSAFALLALHRTLLATADHLPFPHAAYYGLRLLAYVIIFVSIIDRSRRA